MMRPTARKLAARQALCLSLTALLLGSAGVCRATAAGASGEAHPAQTSPLSWPWHGALGAAAGLGLAVLYRRTRRLKFDLARLSQERTRLRQELELSGQRYQQLLDDAGDAIFLIAPDTGALQEINRRALELLGYRSEEIRALSLEVLFPGRHRRRYLALVRKVLLHGYGEEANLRFRRRDGQIFIGAVHARLGHLGDQPLVHAVLRDVTELKRIERHLRQRNQDLTLVNTIAHRAAASWDLKEMLGGVLELTAENFRADGGGVFLVRHGGNVLQLLVHQGIAPELAEELGRLTPGEGLVGRVAISGLPRSSADLGRDSRLALEGVRQSGWRGFQAIPLISQKKTLGVLFLFNRQQRIFSRDELKLLLAIGRQVGTAVEGGELLAELRWQHRLTQASNRELEVSRQQLHTNLARLEEANRALERVDRMKSNFLALASHELRTPLTYVLSGGELLASLLQSRLSPEETRVLDMIRQGGERLETIVQDLLEVARIESQNLYLARTTIDLPALLTDLGREFSPQFVQRRINFTCLPFPEPPAPLLGDPFHLGRTFRRLLENALKFTPNGGTIAIDAMLRSAADIQQAESRLRPFSPPFFSTPRQNPLLQVSVRDTGIGIDPEEHVRIFDKFYEVGDIDGHSSSRSRFGGKGVGLGLTLVKGMVEAHGGMVWVESAGTDRPDAGSAFHVLLPLAAPEELYGDCSG